MREKKNRELCVNRRRQTRQCRRLWLPDTFIVRNLRAQFFFFTLIFGVFFADIIFIIFNAIFMRPPHSQHYSVFFYFTRFFAILRDSFHLNFFFFHFDFALPFAWCTSSHLHKLVVLSYFLFLFFSSRQQIVDGFFSLFW